jgi:hypothetical protein
MTKGNTNSTPELATQDHESIKEGDIESLILKIKEGEDRTIGNLTDIGHNSPVLIIGRTGAGKTTLANYLCGKPLTVKQALGSIVIEGGKGIGNESAGETTEPNFFLDKGNAIAYIDCPGFEDNRGYKQEIPNAFYIRKIFNNVNNFRIIIVIKEADLIGRANELLQTFEGIVKLLGVPSTHAGGMAIIVSGARDLLSADGVKEKLIRIAESQIIAVTDTARDLIKILSSKEARVILFPRPLVMGLLGTELRDRIVGQINNIPIIKKIDARITISEKSENALIFMSTRLRLQIQADSVEVISTISTTFLSEFTRQNDTRDPSKLLEEATEVNSHLLILAKNISKLSGAKKTSITEKDIINQANTETLALIINAVDAINQIISINLRILIEKMRSKNEDLKFCNEISLKPPVMVENSSILTAITNFTTLSSNIQKNLLDQSIVLLNKAMNNDIKKLSEIIINYLKKQDFNFEKLVPIYKSLKAVLDRFKAGNAAAGAAIDIHEQENAKLINFKNAIEELRPILITNNLDSGILDNIISLTDRLFELHQRHPDQFALNGQRALYIQQFSNDRGEKDRPDGYYVKIIEYCQVIIQERINLNVQDITHAVNRALAAITEEYLKITRSEVLGSINQIKNIYLYFHNLYTSEDAEKKRAQMILAALQQANKNIRTERLKDADGLSSLGLCLGIFRQMAEKGLITITGFRETSNDIAARIGVLTQMVDEVDVSFATINVAGMAGINNRIISDHFFQSSTIYREQAERYLNPLQDEFRRLMEVFWTSVTGFLEGSKYSKSAMTQIIVVLSTANNDKPFIDRMRAVHQFILSLKSKPNINYQSLGDALAINDRCNAFYAQHTIVSCSFAEAERLFVAEFKKTNDSLIDKNQKLADEQLVSLRVIIGRFWATIDEYSRSHPKRIRDMLTSIRDNFDEDKGPWDLEPFLRQYCQEKKIDFDKTALSRLKTLYKDYNDFCTDNQKHFNTKQASEKVKEEFWSELKAKRNTLIKSHGGQKSFGCCTLSPRSPKATRVTNTIVGEKSVVSP